MTLKLVDGRRRKPARNNTNFRACSACNGAGVISYFTTLSMPLIRPYYSTNIHPYRKTGERFPLFLHFDRRLLQFVVLARNEGKNTEHAARSVLLKVAPK